MERKIIVVVTGSRHWTNENQIREVIEKAVARAKEQGDRLSLVHGGARGVDTIAGHWAEALGAHVVVERADWSRGRGAGLDRNIRMIEKYEPHYVIAFRSHGKSSGTDHCITQARLRGYPVRLVREID